MRLISVIFFVIIFSLSVSAQTATETLASANGRTFTAQDISPDVAEAWVQLPAALAEGRKSLLEEEIGQRLLKVEAGKKDISVEELLQQEVYAKVPAPTEAEIKEIYDANRAQLGTTTLAEIRPQIVAYLRKEPDQKALEDYRKALIARAKIVPGKDVNAKDLTAEDVLVTVDGNEITYGEFIRKNGLLLYEYEANTFDRMRTALEQTVDSAVYASEAQSLGISTTDYIAREISSKMKEYTEDETARLQAELRKKLYPKYRVRFFIREPEPFIQNISVDDDPFRGKKDAPVTVVMFSDFQCPACSGFYPVMKRVMAAYGDKIRFVVRDFPLEMHENAFRAALAADAANAQGKFFEYKELLYKNQESLDTESLIKYAREIGLNVKKFEDDLKSEKYADEVRHDIADGKSYGVNGTPSVFINGYKLRSLSAGSFREAIERALKNQ